MHLTCSRCGAYGSIELFTEDANARRAIAIAAALPSEVGPLVIKYLSLFAPASYKLSWSRVLKLMQELQAAIELQSINRRGRDWPLTPAMWKEGLQQMLDKRDSLTLPLKTQGYLFEILAGLADKSEAQAERAVEEQRRQGSQARHTPVGQDDVDAQRVHAQRVRQAISSENQARARLKQEPMTADQEKDFVARERLA